MEHFVFSRPLTITVELTIITTMTTATAKTTTTATTVQDAGDEEGRAGGRERFSYRKSFGCPYLSH